MIWTLFVCGLLIALIGCLCASADDNWPPVGAAVVGAAMAISAVLIHTGMIR